MPTDRMAGDCRPNCIPGVPRIYGLDIDERLKMKDFAETIPIPAEAYADMEEELSSPPSLMDILWGSLEPVDIVLGVGCILFICSAVYALGSWL